MSNNGYYVTGMAVTQFVLGAKALGINPAEALEKTGLLQPLPAVTAQVPEPQYEVLLLHLIHASKNPCFGALVGQHLLLSTYEPLITLALNSPTLDTAIGNIARFFSLATGNCGGIECRISGRYIELCSAMIHKNPVIRRHVAECVSTMLLGLIRLLSAEPSFTFSRVWFAHVPESALNRQKLEAMMGCEVLWGKGENKLSLDTHAFKEVANPQEIHHQELYRTAEQQAQRQLERIEASASWIEKVEWHIRDLMLSSSPRRESVAERLQISARTLDRRLEKNGFTWQQVIDNVRLQLATELLAGTELTIAQVARKLGFADVRAFQRGFKNWTGTTASKHRKQLQSK